MFAKLSAAVAMLMLATALAAAGAPEGRYRVVGSNPGGGGKYSGTVSVERTGQTYRVTWQIGRQTFYGTGIGSEKGLAVSYRSTDFTGLAIYGPEGDDWDGVWTVTDGRTIGAERWTRE